MALTRVEIDALFTLAKTSLERRALSAEEVSLVGEYPDHQRIKTAARARQVLKSVGVEGRDLPGSELALRFRIPRGSAASAVRALHEDIFEIQATPALVEEIVL